jgi:hypothetical protein
MHRGLFAALAGAALAAASLGVGLAPAGASGTKIKVSPSTRLTNNQSVTIRGSGLGRTSHGSVAAWFVSECTTKALKVRNLDPDFSPHCSPLNARPLLVSAQGTFSTQFRVATGKVGDGSCGVPGHLTCIIAVGTAAGRHATATIKFTNGIAKSTTTTKPAK